MKNIDKVIVLGAGGTGSLLISALARYLNSSGFDGSLVIIDGDAYSNTNVDRQLFGTSAIGQNKAEYQAKVLEAHLPNFAAKCVTFLAEYVGKDDIETLVTENTVVINCTDNMAARKYVEDKVLTLENGTHICCGNELNTGQVQIHHRKDGKSITPSIYDRIPKFNSTADDRATMSCEELAALPGGGQLIVANMMAATLALMYMIQISSPKNPIYLGGEWVPNDSVWFNTQLGSFTMEGTRTVDFERIQNAAKGL